MKASYFTTILVGSTKIPLSVGWFAWCAGRRRWRQLLGRLKLGGLILGALDSCMSWPSLTDPIEIADIVQRKATIIR